MSNPTAALTESRPADPPTTTVTRGRLVISLGMVAAGTLYTVASLQLDRGELAQPGPGLYPVVVGVLAVLAGLGGLVELARGQAGVVTDSPSSGTRPWVFLAAMSLGVVLLPTVGYVLSATVCGAAVSWTAGQKIWWKALATGLGIAVVSAILFIRVLDVYLPASGIDRMFG